MYRMDKTTPRNFANGKSSEDIIREIDSTIERLHRAGSSEPVVHGPWSYDVKNLIEATASRLASLREKIATSGMETILSDDDAMLLACLVHDDQAPKTDRLADHIGDKRDLERLLYGISDQIDYAMKEAACFDRSWRECGADESISADAERLCALKLCLLRNDIYTGGAETSLSARSSIIIDYFLSAPNTNLRRLGFLDRVFGFRESY